MRVLLWTLGGAAVGAAVGIGVSVYSIAHADYPGDIYWPGMIASDLLLYVLPLACLGALFGAIEGLFWG